MTMTDGSTAHPPGAPAKYLKTLRVLVREFWLNRDARNAPYMSLQNTTYEDIR